MMRAVQVLTVCGLLALGACNTTTAGSGGVSSSGVSYVPTTCSVPADVSLKIVGAPSHMAGVAAEYEWVSRNLPGWSRDAQAQMPGPGGRDYDVLFLVKGNQKKTVCFDISDFY